MSRLRNRLRWIRRVPDRCALFFYRQQRKHKHATQQLRLWHAFDFPPWVNPYLRAALRSRG